MDSNSLRSTTGSGLKIAYYVAGDGPSLILHHGFSRSGQRWDELGYIDRLKDDYRLVAIDARGHGDSAKPTDPQAYALEERVEDVLAVMDAEGIETAHHFGYSMGGQVTFELAVRSPHRARSLIIGGMHPFRREPELLTERIEGLNRSGVDGFVSLFEDDFGEASTTEKEILQQNDPRALAAVTTAIRDAPGLDNAALSQIKLPCLIFCGDHDEIFYSGAQRAAEIIPQATFIRLPGCDHMQAQQADLVIPLMTLFL